MATKVVSVDLAQPPHDLMDLAPYPQAMVVLRWRGRPLDRVWLPVEHGRISAADLWRSANRTLGDRLAACMAEDLVSNGSLRATSRPTCSVVVCTRDRTDDLRRCLDALRPAIAQGTEVIVVDNAPSTDASDRLARTYPVRYLRQPRSGVNWARSLGAQAARGEVVAYCDDDAAVDPLWLEALLEPFADPGVGAVTGLVMPRELETDSQELFERHQSFIRGFSRREFTAEWLPPAAAARAGAGANMAIRRSLINDLRLFDEEMDGGTATLTGGDTYGLYHLLRLGYRIVYEPRAVVWHRHRLDQGRLRRVVYGYSVGTYALFIHCLWRHRDTGVLAVGWDWWIHHHCRELWRGLKRRPGAQPLWLTWAEILGCVVAPWAYLKSRWHDRVTPRPPRYQAETPGGAA